MIRFRFKVTSEDYRPVRWPIKHPYWCTGTDSFDNPVIVAYEDSEEELLKNWPDAYEIDGEEVECYTFTSRFPKPGWFTI